MQREHDTGKAPASSQTTEGERRRRLAEALRRNLIRRKKGAAETRVKTG